MNIENFFGKIIGNYKIRKIIGEGSFSTVFLAEDINFDTSSNLENIKENSKLRNNHICKDNIKSQSVYISKDNNKCNNTKKNTIKKHFVACKIIPRFKIEQKKLTTSLEKEIRIQQIMHHENVVQLIDVQKDTSFYYIFLEFVPCGQLLNIVLKQKKLSEIEAAIFFKQILIGLDYIHSLNVCHRDLKPENILLDSSGRVKIADFGLSKIFNSNNNRLTSTPCGSLCYTSPECISGHPYDGTKSDIWSCGVILYVITAGFFPWTQKKKNLLIYQIKKGDYHIPSFLSDSCGDLIQKLMEIDVDRRISIKEALNHPFLVNIVLPSPKFEYKYVSLKKIDRFLGIDDSFEYEKDIKDMLNEKNISATFEKDIVITRKRTDEIDDQCKMKDENDYLKNLEIIKQYKKISIYDNNVKKQNSNNKSIQYINNCDQPGVPSFINKISGNEIFESKN